MEKTFTVEYIDRNDEEQYEEVVFTGEPHWDNGSFDYAGTHCTGGIGGTHRLPSYVAMDSDATWDKTLYSPYINDMIAAWYADNRNTVEQGFCNQYEEDSRDYDGPDE